MKLEIHGLSVTLQKHEILRDISLTVEEGAFFSLLGPSGCGKSTLLKTIAGIHAPAAGRILLGGRDITALPPHKRRTVIVFQDMRLFPHMSAAENVAYPLRMQGMEKAERLAEAARLLGRVQLAGYDARRVASLSGGEQQRVALARALAAKPDLLLLDEPFSALDENLREEMRRLVLALHREEHMTTVLVTHDREEALAMSDRVALLFQGRLGQCGTPEEVYGQPRDRRTADYFGGCAYFSGAVRDGQFHAGTLTLPADLPDGPRTLCLRPGAWTLSPEGALRCRVESLRFAGEETVLTLRAENGAQLRRRLPGRPAFAEGQELGVAVDAARAIYFAEEERT